MAYTALYRVWRPQTFGEMVGQEHVATTLRNALREGRLSHAYLFNGPRGTGKTSAAKILAKAVNCEQPASGEPCNTCPTCRAITNGMVTDVLEIDAASNRGVEEIRDIRDKVKFAPSDVRYKVYIIDEVHMLTTEAFNALLKTLEEPPPHVLFILATTEPHKLPATIISRCQRFDFHRIPLKEMVKRLVQICEAHQVQAEEQALAMIAKLAEGGMRDALSLLDQVISFSGDRITVAEVLQITGSVAQTYFSSLAGMIADQNVAGVIEQFDELVMQGKDPEQFLQDMMFYYRDMLLIKTAPSLAEVVERTMLDEQFPQVAERYELPRLYDIIEAINQSLSQIKWSTHARVLVELCLIKLCQLAAPEQKSSQGRANVAAAVQPEAAPEEVRALAGRLRALEEKMAQLIKGQPHTPPLAQEEEQRTREARRTAPAQGGFKRVPANKLREVARHVDSALTERIRAAWSQILAELKKVKIQHYAWLVSGQPTAAGSGTLVVTFKSTIHCEKTMEPELKGIVEKALHDLTGQPLQLLSVMEEQWQEAESAEPHQTEETQAEDPFVAEAVKLVGYHLIEIKD